MFQRGVAPWSLFSCVCWYDFASFERLVICLTIEAIAAEDVSSAAGDGLVSSVKDATARRSIQVFVLYDAVWLRWFEFALVLDMSLRPILICCFYLLQL